MNNLNIKFFCFFYLLVFFSSFTKTNAELILKNKISEKSDIERSLNTEDKPYMNNSINNIINFKKLKSLIKANNKEIVQLRSRIKQANYSLNSKNSKWLPTLKFSSNGVPKYSTSFTDRKIGNDTKTDQIQNNFTASIEWDIYNPSRKSNINSAKYNLQISRIDLEKRIIDLYFEAAKKFFLLQRSHQDIKIAKQSIKIAEIALREAEGRFNSGIGNKLEVLETRIQLKRDELALSQKIGNLESTKTELAEILGIEKDIQVDLETKPVVIGFWRASEEESIKYALKNKKELKNIELQIKKNEQDKISSIAGYKPTLSVYDNFTYVNENGESQVSNPNYDQNSRSETNTVGLKFNWLLYDGGETRQNYNLYKERKVDLESLYSVNRLNTINEIKRNFIQINVSIKNIKTAIEQIKSSRESLKISLMRLKAGLSTQREIVNNIGDLTESEGNYIQAVTDYNLNLLALEKNTNLEAIQNCEDVYLKKDGSPLNPGIKVCKDISFIEEFKEFNSEMMLDI